MNLSKSHKEMLRRAGELLQEHIQSTGELSMPEESKDTFIDSHVQGWNIDRFMRTHANWMDTPEYEGERKTPCSMDALYIREKDGVLCLVEFKRDRVLEHKPACGQQCDHRLFVDHSCDDDAKKNADYYHWLCRKMTDTVFALTVRGIADLKNGSWRKHAVAYIVIDGKRNGLRGAGNPVGARLRATAADYAAFPELRGYLFDEIHIVDDQRFRENILGQLASDPNAWLQKHVS
ncbi:hypothetical protein [Bifidobacterium animalis]|uniref:hypothetical protein n=1 Tax=Bifidobacterium animalis TaxID=28025 RepID=UPI00069C188F|nr:hypothetical protein [Bifidobacterium animalis]